jgi:hydroxyethylthiazole kinase-like uncharacterized protein yjeF
MTGSECRQIDQLAMSCLNLSEFQLMQRAADAALGILVNWSQLRRISIYCGPGNNGGDGYLVAAGAKKLGYDVRLFTLGSPASSTAQRAQQAAFAQGLSCEPIDENKQNSFDPQADLIIDALFGHGLERDIGPPLRALFECINASSIPVFALDMPSGINSDTAAVMGIAIKAVSTICFVAPKIGLLTGEGADFAGQLYYDALGIPDYISSQVQASYEWLDDSFLERVLPVPKASSHKGDFGHVAIVGGQPGMPGAVILAARAAARSGAGRVTVISSETHVQYVPLASPVLMTQAIDREGHFNLPDSITALALGPGLGTGTWSGAVYDNALRQAIELELPILLDADGLNLLASQHNRYENWVLSPHPKEAARMLACNLSEIQSNRPRACLRIAERYGGVCVLKGQGSLVASASARRAICTLGNWGMATAGSGDVLSGIIAAMLGQGLPVFEAASAAVTLHAKAGDLAAMALSRRGMISSDIIEYLPEVFQALEMNDA